jgi:hypothetical protein
MDARDILKRGQQAIGVATTLALGHASGITTTGCVSCSYEVRTSVAVQGDLGGDSAPNATQCIDHGCPATLSSATLISCSVKANGTELACVYDAGYADPSESLAEAEEDQCEGLCELGDKFLGCVKLESGAHACITRGGCVGGRRFEGMPSFSAAGPSLAEALAELAHFEACSVTAFERLAEDLQAHGAPLALLRRCRAAARDEARQRELVLALAKANGASHEAIVPAAHADRATPTLLAIALENVAEGCVRESWGAVSMLWLSKRLPQYAALFRSIARDEARHAELSFAIDAWLGRSLSREQRAVVEHARRSAAQELMHALPDPLLGACGVDADTQSAALRLVMAELLVERPNRAVAAQLYV